MKKILLVVALSLSFMLVWSPASKAIEQIDIALLYPLSGALTESGKRMKVAYEVAAKIINGSYDLPGIPYSKTEGIPNLGNAKLVLHFQSAQLQLLP